MMGRSMLMAASNSGGLWTPAAVSPALWYDASDVATITTVDGAVSQWNDKSGNSRHITQDTTASRPLLSAAQLNGMPGVVFDGSNDWLGTSNAGHSGTASVSAFGVWRYITTSGDDIVAGLGQSGQNGQVRAFYSNSTSQGWINWYSDAPTSSLLRDVGGGHHIFEAVQSGASLTLWRNGTVASASPQTLSANPTNGNLFAIGSLQGAFLTSYFVNISLCEMLWFYSAVTESTRLQTEGYLAHKWGLAANLPANHPYKNSAPTT